MQPATKPTTPPAASAQRDAPTASAAAGSRPDAATKKTRTKAAAAPAKAPKAATRARKAAKAGRTQAKGGKGTKPAKKPAAAPVSTKAIVKWALATLALDVIRRDGGTQPRVAIDHDIVREYADEIRAGAKFPPLVVFFDGTHYWLGDGFHRAAASIEAGMSAVECEVHTGTQQEAQWYSFSVNKTHGLRRSNADKQLAVRAALAHPNASGLSDRQIAEHCGVSHNMIGEYRKSMQSTVIGGQSNIRTGRDGRTIDTTNIGKREPPAASQTVFESSKRELEENGTVVYVRTTPSSGEPTTITVPVVRVLTPGEPNTITVPVVRVAPANEPPPQPEDQSPDRHMHDVPAPPLEAAKKAAPPKPKSTLSRGAALADELKAQIEALKSGKITEAQAKALFKDASRQVADIGNDIKLDKEAFKEAFKAACKNADGSPAVAGPVPEESPARTIDLYPADDGSWGAGESGIASPAIIKLLMAVEEVIDLLGDEANANQMETTLLAHARLPDQHARITTAAEVLHRLAERLESAIIARGKAYFGDFGATPKDIKAALDLTGRRSKAERDKLRRVEVAIRAGKPSDAADLIGGKLRDALMASAPEAIALADQSALPAAPPAGNAEARKESDGK
jgi:hypothetical protein